MSDDNEFDAFDAMLGEGYENDNELSKVRVNEEDVGVGEIEVLNGEIDD